MVAEKRKESAAAKKKSEKNVKSSHFLLSNMCGSPSVRFITFKQATLVPRW
jgi:hypothetical protein